MNDRLALSVIGALSAAVVVAVAVLLMGRVPAAGGLDVSGLPRLNAMLNGGSAVLLATGYVFIRRRQVIAHLSCMLGAFVLSTGFLISYVLYHFHAGSRPFTTSPPNVTSPDVMVSSPATMRSRVDLPQPDGPTSTQKLPSGIANVMSRTAVMAPV